MERDVGRRNAGASRLAWRILCAAPLLVGALFAAGCTTDGATGAGGATLAFESIDGPPRPVFDRLVQNLDAEAQKRRVAVVARDAVARYRVRAYLAAEVGEGRTAIKWVWDVYDGELRRAVRLSGEEPAGGKTADAWATADDEVLRRIAASGMRQLAAFLADPRAHAAAPVAAPQSPEPPAPPSTPDQGPIRVSVNAAARG